MGSRARSPDTGSFEVTSYCANNLFKLLSPKAIETRIASPEALIIQVLSPNTLAPKVWSPEVGGLVVLSPSFLSPRIMSKEKMIVEVLSPNIFGGGSSEESKEHNEHCPDEEGEEHSIHPHNVQPDWQLKEPNSHIGDSHSSSI